MQSRTQPGLPLDLRQGLIGGRQRGWSQAELGRRVGLPQMHISKIESGKVTPRFDTLLESVRVLDHDLILVPRDRIPVVRGFLASSPRERDAEEEQPLYAPDEDNGEVS